MGERVSRSRFAQVKELGVITSRVLHGEKT